MTAVLTETTDKLLRLRVQCRCWEGSRHVPVRVAAGMIEASATRLPRNMLLFTYQCRACRKVVGIRARDIWLAAAESGILPRTG